MPSTKYFPFLMGLDQTTDDRLLEPGRPRAIENLAIRKKGRLGMRYDYDALAMTTLTGQTLTLHDLISMDSRLLGLGQINSADQSAYSPSSPNDVIEYVNLPLFAWRGTNTEPYPKLSMASYFRNMGRVGIRDSASDVIDVAAGGGLVAIVTKAGADTLVNVLNAANDANVISVILTGLSLPRVVCTGTKFFIGGVNGTTPKLFRYDPAVDTTVTALADPAAAGGAIVAFDMSLANERTTFWMGYCRTGPTTRIHGFDVNGTETHDFAGPAVLADFVTIYTEASLGAVVRIHFACVINGTTAVNMSTYLGATSALQTNTPAMFAAAVGQVTMCITGVSSTGQVMIARQLAGDVPFTTFVNSTHALFGLATSGANNATLNGKLVMVGGHCFFPVAVTEAIDGSKTTFLVNANVPSTTIAQQRASIVDSRGFSSLLSSANLPNWGLDVSTGKSYWARITLSESGQLNPVIGEMVLASSDRRQSARLGDCLYVAGGAISTFDSRSLAEAGTLGVPRIITAAASTGAGTLTLLGIYQFVAVYEYFDAQGRRIQSAPSEVVTVTLAGANNQVSVSAVLGPYGVRKRPTGAFNGYATLSGTPTVVIYRTQNTALGNLTFYRDISAQVLAAEMGASIACGNSQQSDTALGANEILYTQGSRGALSGPLPFLPPEPCTTLAASADRLLSGGLPEGSRIQESRPLFVGEQINWSNSLGFERDTKGRVLAAARLDERRIVFTANELFELDGPGLDDNGNGDIGAPRRLPSDVGLFGGVLGWRSMVECSLGIMFQGLVDQIYLLPRGGNTPQPIGMAVQDQLAAFSTITAAVYMAADQTVRFTCNNAGGTDSIQLLYDIVQQEWVTEGPFGVPTTAACQFQGRLTMLQSNVVRQQRASHPPAALVANAWRSGTIHPFGLGQFGKVLNYQFYGEYRGDCLLTCTVTYDDTTTEVMSVAEVNAFTLAAQANADNSFFATTTTTTTIAAGSPYSFKFTPGQMKCESVRVDFDVTLPFPNVVALANGSTGTKSTTLNVALPTVRIAGDRVVIAINMCATTSLGIITPPAGWTVRSSLNTAGGGTVAIVERILDGSEPASIAFTLSSAVFAYYVRWGIRNSHPTAALELRAGASNISSASNLALTPTWGAQPTLWLSALTLDTGVTVTSVPTSFRRGNQIQSTDADPEISGFVAGMDRALNAASLTIGTWRWPEVLPASAGVLYAIAIRPNPTLPSEGLAYHYWTMDVEDAGKSALKSPLQMG